LRLIFSIIHLQLDQTATETETAKSPKIAEFAKKNETNLVASLVLRSTASALKFWRSHFIANKVQSTNFKARLFLWLSWRSLCALAVKS